MPYLSPDSLPVETCLIEIEIPNDEKLRQAVMGQIYALSNSYLWEQYGAVTPDQAADAMLFVYDQINACPEVDYAYLAGIDSKVLMGTSGKRLVVFNA